MGAYLSGRAFDCRSRGPQFKSGCPLLSWKIWNYQILDFKSRQLLFPFVKLMDLIYFILFWSFEFVGVIARGYISVVEHLTADQEVPSSNPGAPC